MATKRSPKNKTMMIALVSAGGVVLAAVITIIPKLVQSPPVTKDTSDGGTVTISGDAEQSAVVTGKGHTVTVTQDTKSAEILEKGLPESEYVVVNLRKDVASQIRLFPQDEIEVFDPGRKLKEVWFGKAWEPYSPSKKYIVWGIAEKPVTPMFRGDGAIKIKVSYTRNRDKKRDIDPTPPELRPKK